MGNISFPPFAIPPPLMSQSSTIPFLPSTRKLVSLKLSVQLRSFSPPMKLEMPFALSSRAGGEDRKSLLCSSPCAKRCGFLLGAFFSSSHARDLSLPFLSLLCLSLGFHILLPPFSREAIIGPLFSLEDHQQRCLFFFPLVFPSANTAATSRLSFFMVSPCRVFPCIWLRMISFFSLTPSGDRFLPLFRSEVIPLPLPPAPTFIIFFPSLSAKL